jgi:hypothetical protein
MIHGLNPAGAIYLSPVKCPDQLWGLPSLLFSGYQGLCTGVKQPWCETDHSSVSSAEVKNEGAVPPLLLCAFMVHKGTALP